VLARSIRPFRPDEYPRLRRHVNAATGFPASPAGNPAFARCTPGFLVTAEALLLEDREPSEEEIRTALAGNLRRGTGYQSIVAALKLAIERACSAS
jgi:xanthine dehydrogenase iron-sulfur cluster and FAD-binding subunit A